MSRTNIDIDDELVASAMERFQVRTKREAVDIALKRAIGTPLTKEFMLSLEGMGWDGDLDEMRRSGFEEPDT
jgi:Arc/MetJ family transcription regulator